MAVDARKVEVRRTRALGVSCGVADYALKYTFKMTTTYPGQDEDKLLDKLFKSGVRSTNEIRRLFYVGDYTGTECKRKDEGRCDVA